MDTYITIALSVAGFLLVHLLSTVWWAATLNGRVSALEKGMVDRERMAVLEQDVNSIKISTEKMSELIERHMNEDMKYHLALAAKFHLRGVLKDEENRGE